MKKVVLLIYGEGGHRQEMKLLLEHIDTGTLDFISVGPAPLDESIRHVSLMDVRDKNKHSNLITLLIRNLSCLPMLYKIVKKYGVSGAISTGPGNAILPFILLRLLGKKTVFVETFCRFYTRSITGRVMYRIASDFYVQNKEQLVFYKNAKYSGRL
ncbi:PssD/Cps14F family polysaccharide biosynthesis glycosyltransferase [Pseudoalteromonas fenneropenaei]|uniref:PssD/Cps14F family polysaccharide biosynthesis glycosyltransferase n=1 Tax=Pseudoalteromonas fenneropenaei TaxID=1737459 RepID=A0ABV7CKQ2_9GAMM